MDVIDSNSITSNQNCQYHCHFPKNYFFECLPINFHKKETFHIKGKNALI